MVVQITESGAGRSRCIFVQLIRAVDTTVT